MNRSQFDAAIGQAAIVVACLAAAASAS